MVTLVPVTGVLAPKVVSAHTCPVRVPPLLCWPVVAQAARMMIPKHKLITIIVFFISFLLLLIMIQNLCQIWLSHLPCGW
jgi:hypothetical protein